LPVIRDVYWAACNVGTQCNNNLLNWSKRQCTKMGFGISMVWIDSQGHCSKNCYACVNKFTKLNRRTTVYRSVQSAQLPEPHAENISVPRYPSPTERYIPPTFDTGLEHLISMYEPSEAENPCRHIEISQARLNTMVRQLMLSQRQAVCLAHHLRSVNILAKDIRKRQEGFWTFSK